jgi:hypothetical protein
MSKTRQILILAVIAAAATAGGLIAINPFSDSSVQANQGGSGAQRWEYCAITRVFTDTSGFGLRGKAVIRYFTNGGVREEVIEFAPDIGGRKFGLVDDALSIAIARLGNQKWEMVSKESDADREFKPIYFKRPLP